MESNWFFPWVEAGMLGWEDDLEPWSYAPRRFLAGWLHHNVCVPNRCRYWDDSYKLVMGYCTLPSGEISYSGVGLVPWDMRWPFGLNLTEDRPPPP